MSARLGGDECFRITQKPTGHYVACDTYGNGIGDNIALAREIEPATSFADIVYKLKGAPALNPAEQNRREHHSPPPPPKMPPQQEEDVRKGREYLRFQRKISYPTIKHAETAGVLRYTGDGVLFVGYDEKGQARNIHRRATDPAAEVQKRDIKGSDKSFPVVWPSYDTRVKAVCIVEGGVDALAVKERARLIGRYAAPHVIVSGGVNCQGFLDNPEVQRRLKEASVITIIKEREKDPETQARADAARAKQITKIQEISGKAVKEQEPRVGKDIADELKQTPEHEYRHRTTKSGWVAKLKTQEQPPPQQSEEEANKVVAARAAAERQSQGMSR